MLMLRDFIRTCNMLLIPWEVMPYDNDGNVVWHYHFDCDADEFMTLVRTYGNSPVTYAYLDDEGVAVAHVDHVDND